MPEKKDYGKGSAEDIARYASDGRGTGVALGQAARGGANLEEVKKNLEVTGRVVEELDKLVSSSRAADLEKVLRERTSKDAETLGTLFRDKASLERMEADKEGSPYAPQLAAVKKDIERIGGLNPFARRLANENAARYNREQAQAKRQIVMEGAIPLHDACGGKPGPVVCPIRFQVRDKESNKLTEKVRTGLVRIEVVRRGGQMQGHIIDATFSVRFLTNYGTGRRDGKPCWVTLRPPTFATGRGEGFFPNLVKDGLAELYGRETVGYLLDGKAIRVEIVHPNWGDGGNRGRIKLDVRGDGQGNVAVHQVVTEVHTSYTDMAGKTFTLGDLEPRLSRLLRAAGPRKEKPAEEPELEGETEEGVPPVEGGEGTSDEAQE